MFAKIQSTLLLLCTLLFWACRSSELPEGIARPNSTETPISTASPAPLVAPTSTGQSITTPEQGPSAEAETYYLKGVTYFNAGSIDEAIASFEQAISLYPAYAEAYRYRGDAYRQQGRFDLAKADYRQALALSTDAELRAIITASLEEIAQSRAPTKTPAPPATPTLPASPLVKIELNEPFPLKINQAGRLDSVGLTIEFLSVFEDSRCPVQVDCAQAGQARISIFVGFVNMEPAAFELNTNSSLKKDVIPFDDYQIRLLKLEPYPETLEEKIPPADYQAMFVISMK